MSPREMEETLCLPIESNSLDSEEEKEEEEEEEDANFVFFDKDSFVCDSDALKSSSVAPVSDSLNVSDKSKDSAC